MENNENLETNKNKQSILYKANKNDVNNSDSNDRIKNVKLDDDTNNNNFSPKYNTIDDDQDIILAQDIEGEVSSGKDVTDIEGTYPNLKLTTMKSGLGKYGDIRKKFIADNNDDEENRSNKSNDDEKENSTKHIIESSPKGRFARFDEELGAGAFKHVYRAFDYENGREVAWNTISVHSMSDESVDKIRDEIAIIKKLNHPNIMHFVSGFFNEDKKEVVIITEIFTGGSLKKHLDKIKYPRLKVIKYWCKEILKGLNYLHSLDPPLIHRDIKCDNIFINSNSGQIKIGDLGYSCILKNDYAKSALGTPEFMAPDVLKGRYGVLVDIYSFGMCILEMVTLEKPYKECENVMAIFDKVRVVLFNI